MAGDCRRRMPGAVGNVQEETLAGQPGFVLGFRGQLASLDTATGDIDWQFRTVPVGYTGGRMVRSGSEAVDLERGSLHVLDRRQLSDCRLCGHLSPARTMAIGDDPKGVGTISPSPGSVSTAGGGLYGGDDAGYFMALDAFTGKILWKFQSGGHTIGGPALFDGSL